MAQLTDLGAELNLVCRHGHTVGPLSFTWTDSTDAPINLTSATFESKIYDNKKDLNQLESFTITVTGAVAGTFDLTLSAAESAALPLETMFYIVSITLGSVKSPMFYGSLELRPA